MILKNIQAVVIAIALVVVLHPIGLHSQPYGLNDRPAAAPFLGNVLPEAAPLVSGTWSSVPAFPNLYFTNALGVTFVPGTNRLCVWEREGRVWSFQKDTNVTEKKLVLDLHTQCQGWDDSGLLGLAFHPGFATNHFMFVYFTWVIPGMVAGDENTRPPMFVPDFYHDRLCRYTLDADGVAIPSSELVLIDQIGSSVWHNGGGLFFHPTNGFLYYTDGDDADTGNTQIITNKLLSGVFRIDVDQRGGNISHPIVKQPAGGTTANYFIPNDNPFVGVSNVLEEFFCLGLRSPHRMTIDPPTGRIFIGDVGASSREEVDIIEPGESALNFQWSTIEGLQGDLTPPYVGINRRPAIDYTHSEGFAVIGGYVYRGSEFASDLAGKYIFGDNGSRTIWVLDESSTPNGKIPICTMPRGDGPNSGNDYCGLSSFGLDENNEIYLCQMSSIGGRIYKLSRTAPSPLKPLPPRLSQVGAFTNLNTLTPAAGFVSYDVNSPLWSDNAAKSRWIALPTGKTIGYATTGEWTFPPGTVLMKHFELPTNEVNPALRKRLETRLIVCDTNGTFYGASYKWRADNSDADLVELATNEIVSIATTNGSRTQTWSYPGRQDCLRCHTLAAGGVLGVKTRQLNGNFTYQETGVTDNQLRTWNHIGMFSATQSETALTNAARLVSISDATAPLETRARSYLDANCAHCHRPGGAPAYFDARFDTPLANQGITNGAAINLLNITGAKIVVPGSTAQSILFHRLNALGPIQMPPLAKNVVHSNAVTVIADWINSITNIIPVITNTVPTNGVPMGTNGLPAGWFQADVGTVGLAGSGNGTNNQFNVTGGGWDIWGNEDAFHFVYQGLNGDGEIRARVVGLQPTSGWAKAGVMFRENLTKGSRHAFACITSGQGSAFQRRLAPDGLSAHTAGPFVPAPYWVRLVRTGNLFTGYTSADGNNWVLVDTDTLTVTNQIFVGLAVCAQNDATTNRALFDNVLVLAGTNVTITNIIPVITNTVPTNGVPMGTNGLPAGWFQADVGTVGLAGSGNGTNNQFNVTGGGWDIWGNEDAFHFVYQGLNGDGEIRARVVGLQPTSGWAKAGVMFRENLTKGSRHAFACITSGQGSAFQRRLAPDGLSAHTAGPFVPAPYWVRLVRTGNLFTGYTSADGNNWVLVDTDTLTVTNQIFVGLAVCAQNDATTNRALFDNVLVLAGTNVTITNIIPVITNTVPTNGVPMGTNGLPAGWFQADVGTVGLAGSGNGTNNQFNVTGGGWDIWGNEDAFHFVYQGLNGDGEIRARVVGLQPTSGWAKAGVMFRENLTKGSRHAFACITSGQGSAFQRRLAPDGLSAHTAGPFVPAPYWVRLVRTGNLFTGYTSADGNNWVLVDTDTLTVTNQIFVGLAVCAQNDATTNRALFDNVLVLAGTNVTITNIIPVITNTVPTNGVPMGTNGLPAGWFQADVGTVGLAGSGNGTNNQFNVTGGGWDIWGNEDAFHFVYQGLNGDGEIRARVVGLQPTSGWAKAGVMFRENLTKGSRHAFACITSGQGSAFQRRLAPDGLSAHTAGPFVPAPYWVRLVRTGNLFTGYTSADGNNWVLVDTDTLTVTNQIFVGLAVCAQNDATTNRALFDNVLVLAGTNVTITNIIPVITNTVPTNGVPMGTNGLPAGWFQADVGTVGLAGSGNGTNNQFNVTGGGWDIWGNEDAFHFVYQGLNGDGEIRARVVGLQPTSGWAKAGVMFRENLTKGSRHAFACITSGQGSAFQRRLAPDGLSAHTAGPFVPAPYWVRLVRTGNLFTGYTSADGNNWVLVDTDTLTVTNQIFVGLAVCAQNDATTNRALFDNVLVLAGTNVVAATKISSKSNAKAAVTIPLRINPPILKGQDISFSFDSLKGQSYVIEASTNLKSSWLPVFTNMATNDVFDFSAPLTNLPLRFYRVKVP